MGRNFTVAFVAGLIFFISVAQGQNVFIPDSNFKSALVSNSSINTNGDSEIQVSEAEAVTGILNVSFKSISDLTGIQAFINLTGLYCNNNNLASLDVSQNTRIRALRCNHNQLTALDVSHNTTLNDLRCYVNRLTSLNVSANTELSKLYCYNNQISSLNTSTNLSLSELRSAFNLITALDLSGNTNLTVLECNKNRLASLNVKNGHNTSMAVFNASGNPQLTCIQVDDPAYSQSHWTNHDAGVTFSTDCGGGQSDVVFIPDANFKAALVANSSINKNGDGEIQQSEARNYKGSIYVVNKNIADLTGIEAFILLTGLDCSINQLTTLSIANNPRVRDLKCYRNRLTSLNTGSSASLTTLTCYNNNLTALDISQNTGLTSVFCQVNQLASLDISSNTNLTTLQANNNRISTFNSAVASLTSLELYTNHLSNLDVSASPGLTYLGCMVNDLDSLDLSANTSLTDLRASNNELTYLNLKNGNNTRFTNIACRSNPDLYCVEVDDPAYSEANWRAGFADQVSFATDCSPGGPVVYIPDPNFKAALVADASININRDSEIQVFEAEIFDGTMDVASRNIADMTGLEAFTALQGLECEVNQLTTLDVSHNVELRSISCSSNQLTSLDVRANTSLSSLICQSNQISTLTMNGLTSLLFLACDNNQLSVVNINSLRNLSVFSCSNNSLSALDANGNFNLTELDCRNNQIGSLNLLSVRQLGILRCSGNLLTSLDVSVNTRLFEVNCSDNQITSLDFRQHFLMEALNASNNQLTVLNMKDVNINDFGSFNAKGNPSLACIEVDNVEDAERVWRDDVDPGAEFSTNCGAAAETLTAEATRVSVYPNPTSDRVKIESDAAVEAVQVFDTMNGALVGTSRGSEVDLSHLREGLYMIKVYQGQNVTSFRVMKR